MARNSPHGGIVPVSRCLSRYARSHGAARRTIPFGASTYNSAVESAHRLIEDECYGTMWMPTRKGFFARVTAYHYRFTIERVNTYRGATPLSLLREKATAVPYEVLMLPPIEVETLLTRARLTTWRSWQDGVP